MSPRRVAPWWWRRVAGRLEVRRVCVAEANAWAWYPVPVPMVPEVAGFEGRRPTPERISAALDMRGVDGPEVDEALGVANALDTVVDDWEAGREVPSMVELRRLAWWTGFSVEWFFEPARPVGTVFICRRGRR